DLRCRPASGLRGHPGAHDGGAGGGARSCGRPAQRQLAAHRPAGQAAGGADVSGRSAVVPVGPVGISVGLGRPAALPDRTAGRAGRARAGPAAAPGRAAGPPSGNCPHTAPPARPRSEPMYPAGPPPYPSAPSGYPSGSGAQPRYPTGPQARSAPAATPPPRPAPQPSVSELEPATALGPTAAPRSPEINNLATSMMKILRPGRAQEAPPGSIKIGRAVDNDIVIPDVLASRHHATLVPTPAGMEIRDNRSINGTFVNGTRTETA